MTHTADEPTVCIAHGRFIPCRKGGEHRYTTNPYWVKYVRDYQSSTIEGLTWEPAWERPNPSGETGQIATRRLDTSQPARIIPPGNPAVPLPAEDGNNRNIPPGEGTFVCPGCTGSCRRAVSGGGSCRVIPPEQG